MLANWKLTTLRYLNINYQVAINNILKIQEILSIKRDTCYINTRYVILNIIMNV